MNDTVCAPLTNTPRVTFRPISVTDADALFPIWSDPRVTEFLVLEPFVSVEEAAAMAELLANLPERGEGARWVMTEAATGRIMGTLGFHNVKREHRRAEIGYEIAPQFWGAGLMSEALQSLLQHCFHNENTNRLEAFVNLGNERSYRVLERAGFLREGTLRNYEFARGRFIDQIVFSLLEGDWRANRQGPPPFLRRNE